jgi:hypothetical protein
MYIDERTRENIFTAAPMRTDKKQANGMQQRNPREESKKGY